MEASPRTPTSPGEGVLRAAVAALGAFHVLLGGWQFIAPGSFFEEIGRYGAENTHYVGDAGSFTAAYGIALLLAAGRPGWRAPLLVAGAIWYALHAFNHLLDIEENAISEARGALDTVLLALGAILLYWLARASERARRGGPP